jgi:hypothetical protein
MSTKKGKTKKELRIEAEKAALRVRLSDMFAGAIRGMSMQDDGEDDVLVGASGGFEEIAGWLHAARVYLDFTRDDEAWPQSWTDTELMDRAFHYDNLQHFDTLNKAVEHLYSYGFRA